jgi:hypothetical protein
MHFSKDYRN